MEAIYHLVSRSQWEQSANEDYRADSLDTEGFIHCSFARQVAWAANRFHTGTADLVVLEIDATRLASPLRVEPPSGHPNSEERFPHIHGPLNRSAVVAIRPLARGDDGQWRFPA